MKQTNHLVLFYFIILSILKNVAAFYLLTIVNG